MLYTTTYRASAQLWGSRSGQSEDQGLHALTQELAHYVGLDEATNLLVHWELKAKGGRPTQQRWGVMYPEVRGWAPGLTQSARYIRASVHPSHWSRVAELYNGSQWSLASWSNPLRDIRFAVAVHVGTPHVFRHTANWAQVTAGVSAFGSERLTRLVNKLTVLVHELQHVKDWVDGEVKFQYNGYWDAPQEVSARRAETLFVNRFGEDKYFRLNLLKLASQAVGSQRGVDFFQKHLDNC